MIYDISQPVFGCAVYPGNPVPELTQVHSIEKGDHSNLTAFYMCTHNGTHTDAPLHFYTDGKSVDLTDLEKYVGPAYVVSHNGEVTAADAEKMLEKAVQDYDGAQKRILIRGDAAVTLEAAKVFAASGLYLLGSEAQAIGPKDGPGAVHLVLLKTETVLLEGIRLSAVSDGAYILNCAPLNLNGAEGAPCRAILMDIDEFPRRT